MKYNYYLTIDSNIEQSFSDGSYDLVKESLNRVFEEKDELTEIAIYKAPFDVNILSYRDLLKYGVNVTTEFLNSDDNYFIL